ncbi:MAG: DUF5320 domain-containing protein [Melioribacteraceae bacterium]|nr:DUF5320 domain-containing protein [Melioribacteraceae bacterium]
MPSGDRTGPIGNGPMTGRKMGFCTGTNNIGLGNRRGGRRFAQNRNGFRRMNQDFFMDEDITQQTAGSEVENLRQEINSLKTDMSTILEKLEKLT